LVVDLLELFGDTVDRTLDTESTIVRVVLELLSASSHTGQGRRGTEFDESLEFEVLEENILSFDPANRRSELVSEELDEAVDDWCQHKSPWEERRKRDEHCVTELVSVLISSPILFVPNLENLLETRR